jgi:hypothetical protein
MAAMFMRTLNRLYSRKASRLYLLKTSPTSYHSLEEPMRHPLPTLLGEDGKAERSTNVSELEKDMLLAFKEQE